MNITFRPFTEQKIAQLKPVPAISMLPDWYKEMSPYTEGKAAKYFANGAKNLTVKRCNPFGDALGFGYFILLENSISVEAGNPPKIVWHRGGKEYIGEHGSNQVSPKIIPNGYSSQLFKFRNDWSIETPKGYSVLFTHPLNAYTTPFLTLSGVVDTDSYTQAVNFPFLIKSDFTGIIESGTPIAQIVPFKREPWLSKFLDFDPDFFETKQAQFNRHLERYYKRFAWHRKEYK